jgi:hypothetical protein
MRKRRRNAAFPIVVLDSWKAEEIIRGRIWEPGRNQKERGRRDILKQN